MPDPKRNILAESLYFKYPDGQIQRQKVDKWLSVEGEE